MAVVAVRFQVPQPDGTLTAASGALRFTPTARRVITGTPDVVVLPAGFPAELAAGAVDVTLTPTTAAWVWRVDEYLTGAPARTIYVQVPDVASVDYAELVPIDPATLEPSAAPEPAWVAMANSTVTSGTVTGDDLVLTRTDGTTVNAGNVRGAAGATGATGAAGATGATGPQGPAGESAGITFTTLTNAGQAVTIPAGNVAGIALTQDSTGGRTATWPAGIRWDGGTVPTLSTASGATDVFTFIALTGGGWLGKKDGSHPAPADTTAPSAVTGLTAGTATATSIPLSWTAATDNVGIAGYEYSTNGTTYTATGSTGTTYTVTGLTASTSYTLYVRAYDAAGNRGAAASVVKSTAAAGLAPGDIITSDSFNRADVASVGGTNTDAAAGGSALAWISADGIGITANQLAPGTNTAVKTAKINLPTATSRLKVAVNLATVPTGGNLEIYMYAGATMKAMLRMAASTTLYKEGFGSLGNLSSGAGLLTMTLDGTALSATGPGSSTVSGVAAGGSIDNIVISTNANVTAWRLDDLVVSVPA